MKKTIRNLLILLFPFLIMILINETSSPIQAKKIHEINGVVTQNSAQKLKSECSWACYYSTQFCKENHVKISSKTTESIDPIYFGIINSLKSTGNYGLANLIVFVIIFPFLIFYFLIRILDMQTEISQVKKLNK